MEITPIRPEKTPEKPRNQRLDGHARLRFGPQGLVDLYQRAPCKLLFPVSDDASWHEATSLTTSGGLTGGDRIRLDLSVESGGRLSVSTQAAEKLYRVLPQEADIVIDTHIDIAAGGRMEWLAQEAIAFDRTRFRRRLTASMAGDARLLAVESLVLGRLAMGETFSAGLLHDEWRIRRDGRLIWADGLHVEGADLAASDGRFRFGGAKALATLLYAGPDAASHIDAMRALLPETGGATCMGDLLILRLCDSDPARMKAGLMRLCAAMRRAAFGRAEQMPAMWTC